MAYCVRILVVVLSLAYAFAATMASIAAADMQIAMADGTAANMAGCSTCGDDGAKKQSTCNPACSTSAVAIISGENSADAGKLASTVETPPGNSMTGITTGFDPSPPRTSFLA